MDTLVGYKHGAISELLADVFVRCMLFSFPARFGKYGGAIMPNHSGKRRRGSTTSCGRAPQVSCRVKIIQKFGGGE